VQRIRFERGYPEHVRYITPQPEQRAEWEAMLQPGMQTYIEESDPVSGWVGSKCVGICGLRPIWGHRYEGWALLSSDATDYMLPITRRVRLAIEQLPPSRVEMVVHEDFMAGRKWARALGFKLETPHGMTGFYADGKVGYLYARQSWRL